MLATTGNAEGPAWSAAHSGKAGAELLLHTLTMLTLLALALLELLALASPEAAAGATAGSETCCLRRVVCSPFGIRSLPMLMSAKSCAPCSIAWAIKIAQANLFAKAAGPRHPLEAQRTVPCSCITCCTHTQLSKLCKQLTLRSEPNHRTHKETHTHTLLQVTVIGAKAYTHK